MSGSAVWRGTPWGPADDPGEIASMAADERSARSPTPIGDLCAELTLLRVETPASTDERAVEIAKRTGEIVREIVASTRATA